MGGMLREQPCVVEATKAVGRPMGGAQRGAHVGASSRETAIVCGRLVVRSALVGRRGGRARPRFVPGVGGQGGWFWNCVVSVERAPIPT